MAIRQVDYGSEVKRCPVEAGNVVMSDVKALVGGALDKHVLSIRATRLVLDVGLTILADRRALREIPNARVPDRDQVPSVIRRVAGGTIRTDAEKRDKLVEGIAAIF
jgi:hypothetical protein